MPGTLTNIDSQIERLLLQREPWTPRSPQEPLLALGVVILMVLALVLKYSSDAWASVDLFVFPVVTGCFLFRRQGVLIVVTALVLDFVTSWQAEVGLGGLTPPSSRVLVESLLQSIELGLIGTFVVVTLDKWADLRLIKRRTDDDLDLAKALQSSLINQSYALGQVAIEGSIHQCDSVGGDFFYFRPFEKKMVTFCLGDVMGKGISASLMMSMVMSFVYEWGKRSTDPSEVTARLNRRVSRLWDGKKGWFLTIFYAIFDEETGLLKYCAAGQQGGYILRGSQLPEALNECDPPVGVVEPYDFECKEVQLHPGDRVVLFTDGVSEARSPDGELFSSERVGEFLLGISSSTSGRDLVERLEQEVLEFTGGIYTDDMGILHFEYLQPS